MKRFTLDYKFDPYVIGPEIISMMEIDFNHILLNQGINNATMYYQHFIDYKNSILERGKSVFNFTDQLSLADGNFNWDEGKIEQFKQEVSQLQSPTESQVEQLMSDMDLNPYIKRTESMEAQQNVDERLELNMFS